MYLWFQIMDSKNSIISIESCHWSYLILWDVFHSNMHRTWGILTLNLLSFHARPSPTGAIDRLSWTPFQYIKVYLVLFCLFGRMILRDVEPGMIYFPIASRSHWQAEKPSGCIGGCWLSLCMDLAFAG